MDCPSAVTARVTAKRCSLDALTLAEGLLDLALSPCHGAPRTRGYRGGTHATPSPGLHRASRVRADLRWSEVWRSPATINVRILSARLSRPGRFQCSLPPSSMDDLLDALVF